MSKLLGVKNKNQKRPCRPFTAYNIFFHLEKERVLQGQGGGYAAKIKTIQPIDQNLDLGAALRPARYQNLVLPAEWYLPDPDKKRRMATKKNRDPPHRIITFVELSKMISSEWKVIDEETKTYCTELAGEQLRLYNEEMKDFVAKYGAEAAKKSSKLKTKGNKIFSETEKPTKRAGEGAGDGEGEGEGEAEGQVEAEMRTVEAGYIKLTNDVLRQAKDQDIWEFSAESKNWIKSFQQEQDWNGGQNDARNKQIDYDSLDIEPEPMSSKVCDYISPTMCYWANQFATGFHFDFRSQSTSLSQHMQLTPIEKLEQPTSHVHKYKTRLSNATSSCHCQGFESEDYYGQTRLDAITPDQSIDFDMNGFDWNWDPNPFSDAFDAHMSNEQIELSISALNGQELPSRAYHVRSRYPEQSQSLNVCLGCRTCSCARSAAFQKYDELCDYRPI